MTSINTKSTSVDSSTRLTPAQFKALAKYKGWSTAAMAKRWEISVGWLRDTIRDAARPVRYDDALSGLPNLNRLRQEIARRERRLQAALGALPVPKIVKAIATVPGHRYRPYLSLGSIVGATKDIGSVAEEGVRGIVFQIITGPTEDQIGVIFETGMWEWFSPDWADDYLAVSGLSADGMDQYVFKSEAALQSDFDRDHFSFYPVVP